MEEPRQVAFVIVTWNARDVLLDCLRSIYETCQGLGFEVVVVDNGSSDGSAEVLRSAFPMARVIVSKRNLGFAEANNLGLTGNKAKYAVLLNADARLCPGAAEILVDFMERHPDAGAAGAQLLNKDGSRQNSIANFPSLATELLSKDLLKLLLPWRFPSKHFPAVEPVEVQSVIGACMMVRLSALREVGGLDERFFFFLEETDLCYQLKRRGWRVWHVPGARAYHFKGHSAHKRSRTAARLEYYRSMYTFFRKNRGAAQWRILRALNPVKLLIECAFSAIGCALTFFLQKPLVERTRTYGHLLGWHLRLCPGKEGLKHFEEVRV